MGAWLSLFFTSSSKIITVQSKKYIIDKLIGEGGFAFVYLVHDPYTDQIFAIKKIICQTDEALNGAKREIEILTSFKHKNLLQVHAHEIRKSKIAGAEDVFLLMPFYKRGTLQNAIDDRKGVIAKHKTPAQNHMLGSEQKLLSSFLTICYGVRELHSKNPPYSHNDLKPANVLIANDVVNLVLFDFGSCAPARHLMTSRKEALALQEWADSNSTPLFRAPELYDIKSDALIDERTDVWSLGCILYAMAFLESPFEADASYGSTSLAVQSGNLHFPNDASRRFTKAFLDLIRLLLTVDLQKRPFIDDVITRIVTFGGDQQDVKMDVHSS